MTPPTPLERLTRMDCLRIIRGYRLAANTIVEELRRDGNSHQAKIVIAMRNLQRAMRNDLDIQRKATEEDGPVGVVSLEAFRE